MLAVGDKAPGFSAEATTGTVDLAGLLEDGPVVVYFYPKANTSG